MIGEDAVQRLQSLGAELQGFFSVSQQSEALKSELSEMEEVVASGGVHDQVVVHDEPPPDDISESQRSTALASDLSSASKGSVGWGAFDGWSLGQSLATSWTQAPEQASMSTNRSASSEGLGEDEGQYDEPRVLDEVTGEWVCN